MVIAGGFTLRGSPHGVRPTTMLAAALVGVVVVAIGHLAGMVTHYVLTRARIRPWSSAGTEVRAELGATALVIRARALPVRLRHDDVRLFEEYGPVITLGSWDGRTVTFPRALLPEGELAALAALASVRRGAAARR
jgi:hypothetical protein